MSSSSRASAIDAVLMKAAFATPSTFFLLREQLSSLNVYLGGVPLSLFAPMHLPISSLPGSVVTVWSVLLVRGQPVLWLFIAQALAWGLAQSLPLHPGQGERGGQPHESLLR